MMFVKIRAGPVLAKVVRIDQNRIASIRSVVERVAVSVRDSERERSAGVSRCGLMCVMSGIGDILQRENSPQTRVGPPREGIHVRRVSISTSCLQIHVGGVLRRHQCSILQKKRSFAISGGVPYTLGSSSRRNVAIRDGQWLVRPEGILARRQRRQLVELTLHR